MQMYDSTSAGARFHQYTPLIMMYYLFAPMEDLLTGSMGTVAKYIAMFIIFLGLVSTGGELHLNYSSINKCLIYLMLLSAASCLWATDRAVAINRNVAYLLIPGLAFFVGQLDFSPKERESIITAAIVGGIATAIYLVISGQINLGSMQRLQLTKANDQNGFAASIFLPFGLCVGRILNQELWKKCAYAGLSLLFLFIILLTGSRGALLGVFAFVLAFAFFSQKGKRARTIIGVLALLVLAYYVVLPLLPEYIQKRLFNNDSYVKTMNANENRTAFWKLAFTEIFPKHPVLGVGAGCTPLWLGRFYSTNRGMHNTYINMLCEYGVLGLPIFLWMLWSLFYEKKKQGKLIELALLTGICVIVFFLDAYPKKYFWNVLMLLMIEPKRIENPWRF